MNWAMYIVLSLCVITITSAIFLYGYGLGVRHTKLLLIRRVMRDTPKGQSEYPVFDDID